MIRKLLTGLVLSTLVVQGSYAQDLMKILTAKFGSGNVMFKDSSMFKEYYEIKFRQPIDHLDTAKGFFSQLILLGHNDTNRPMIIETNGYQILPYQDIKYVAEPAKILKGNQIIVEHRYFGQSIPDSNDNRFLNFKQITADYHNIKNTFSDIYKSEWISTGASKGGFTALNYSYFYPEDITASIVYVAPIIVGLEDKRIKSFLQEKRSTETGKKLFTIQQDLLQRKQVLMPIFIDILKLSHLDIGSMDPETLYDFAVLEFDFNYWQYISDFEKLTLYNRRALEDLTKNGLKNTSLLLSQSDSMIATFPMCIWFLFDKPLAEPYYYQSFTQMGSYGYEENLFKGLKYNKYSPEFLAGEHPKYSWKYIKTFNRFLKTKLRNTIFIYGAEDPWTACKPTISTTNDNLIIINPKTNHSTLVKDFAESDKIKVKEKLSKWIKTEVTID